MKKGLVKLFLVAVAALWGGLPLFAQHPNLIPNSGFDDASSFSYTDYEFAPWEGGLGGDDGSGKLAIATSSTYCNINFFPCSGHGGSGNFLVVNGDGGDRTVFNLTGNTPSNKKVVIYTIPVQPSIFYDFSFWATHLCNGNVMIGTARVDFKVKFNNESIGNNWTPQFVNNTANWDQFPTYRWLSGNNSQVEICFYDDCVWTSDYGDDFGLDDICFQMASEYAVSAENFSVSCCNSQATTINVLEHCTINQPSGQPSLPVDVEIIEDPQNGVAIVSGNDIVFTPNSGFVGTDQIRFGVTKYGLSDEAVISINVSGQPSGFVISGIPEDHLCADGFVAFSPIGTCDANGSPIINSGWEYATELSGPWNALSLPLNLEPNDYYLRFWAENDCGRAESEPTPLRVCDKPELNTMTISEPPVICEGAWLPADYLAQVWATSWNNDNGTASWEVSHGDGVWILQTSLSNGDWLRYRAENCCGEVVTDAVMVHTTQGPEFTNDPYPNPFAPYYCLGVTLDMPSDHPQFDPHGMNATGFWAYLEGNDYQRIDGNPTLTADWDGRIITYVLDSDCGGLIPYRDQYLITVVLPPEVQLVSVAETVCVGGPVTAEFSVEWHHGTPDLQQCTWRYAPVDNPTAYHDFYPADGIPEEGVYYVNYHAVANECGFEADGAEPKMVTVLFAQDEWLPDISACDSYTHWTGQVITQDAELDSVSDEPCYHIVHQPIVIYHSDSVVEPITSCHDVFYWHDMTFYRSDQTQVAYWDTINALGCDSVRELRLDFGDYNSFTYNETACNSYIWEIKPDTVYTQSAQDALFVPAVDDTDCDTWYYLELTLGHDTIVNVDTSVCGPFSWYGQWCDASTTYTYQFETPLGCDSVVNLFVTMNKTVTNNRLVSACDTITILGVLYDEPGVYRIPYDTLVSPHGCDSIVIITLNLQNSENIGNIHGESLVYVATNIISGIYRYEIDAEDVIGGIDWSLSNPEWLVIEQEAYFCYVMVTTPGSATLTARFMANCGEMERHFFIQANFFDVADYQLVEAHVFPNPTQGQVTVEAEGIEGVRVIDMLGQTLDWIVGEGTDRLSFDLHAFEPSVYLLEIKTVNGTAMRRLVLCE